MTSTQLRIIVACSEGAGKPQVGFRCVNYRLCGLLNVRLSMLLLGARELFELE